ncbi:hypothetical protein PAEPH01_0527 [Pancytospora epiphaga]|nr:hypothetical protein PAEPH01_0527 [Pancytospora epiphaga]
MRQKDLTLFDLSTAGDYIVVAGGGGDEAYGKKNGVLVIAKKDLESPCENPGVLYKTPNLIREIKTYVEGGDYTDFSVDECSLGESSIFEGFDAAEPKEKTVDKNTERLKAKDTNKVLYIIAVGEEVLYMLKFDGAFTLLATLNVVSSQVYFQKHLILLVNGTVYGFYDPGINPDSLKLQNKKDGLKDSHEEYFYNIYRRDNKLIYKREGGTVDVPDGWNRFFIYQDKIHKVLYSAGVSTFVFKNKQYSYDGEISCIYASFEMLVFYITHSKNAHLYFISNEEKVFQLPKITCLKVEKDITVVATCTGDMILYVSGVYYNKTHVSNIPITGVSLDSERIYFSLLNGEIGKVKIRRKYSLGMLFALMVLVVAIVYGIIRKK